MQSRNQTGVDASKNPYIACMLAPPSASPGGMGFPDGSPLRSIVVDFKQVFTITPSSGTIKFALVSSPFGCLALQQGSVSSIAVPQYSGTSSLAYTWVDSAVNMAVAPASFSILPFQENASYPVDGEFMGAYSIGQYRGLVISAESTFTGSSMYNGGVVSVYKATPNIVPIGTQTVNTVDLQRFDLTDVNPGATALGISGRFTGPARAPLSIRSASCKPEYRGTIEKSRYNEIVPYFLTSAGARTDEGLTCGFDNTVPLTVFHYSGLDASASITVEIRSCMELVPRVGVMAAFAKPSPPASISTWEKVANVARSFPAATILRAAASGLTGYASGGLAGGLMALSHAM